MHQYDDPSAVPAMPAPPPAAQPGFFSDGNPLLNLQGTRVDAHFLNVLMVELLNLLTAADIAPNRTQYDQVLQAIEALIARANTNLAKTIPPPLGFTPVQQGGGHAQGTNKVYVGWRPDGSGLGVTVDVTDLGNVVFQSALQQAVAALQQQIQASASGAGRVVSLPFSSNSASFTADGDGVVCMSRVAWDDGNQVYCVVNGVVVAQPSGKGGAQQVTTSFGVFKGASVSISTGSENIMNLSAVYFN